MQIFVLKLMKINISFCLFNYFCISFHNSWHNLRYEVETKKKSPQGVPERKVILMLTYSVVVFSILVQGLTVGRVARALGLSGDVSPTADGQHH